MTTDDLEHTKDKLKSIINETHDNWKDVIWDFVYQQYIIDIEKSIPEIISDMNNLEKAVNNKVREIENI